MSNRTILLGELGSWKLRGKRSAAIERMRVWIVSDSVKRSSPLPDMLLIAADMARASRVDSPAEMKTLYKQRLTELDAGLRADYITRRNLKKLSGRVPNRLHALARICINNEISSAHPLPKLYLSTTTDLRISLPPLLICTFNGKVVVLALCYDDKKPVRDSSGYTVIGQRVAAGLSLAIHGHRARDDRGYPFLFPSRIDDIIILDLARPKRSDIKFEHFVSAIPKPFLISQKRVVTDTCKRLSADYADACKLLGLNPRARVIPIKQDNETPEQRSHRKRRDNK